MRVLLQLARRELARIGAGGFGKLVLVALLLVPSIYGGLLIWSNLDVTTHLDDVPAAVVDLDAPVTVTDANGKHERIDLGRTVSDRLVDDTNTSNLDWRATSQDDARRGLADGTYYAVLTIPAGFSAAATSTSDAKTARKANLQLDTNDATSYLAGNIASSIGAKLQQSTGDSIAQRYLDRVYLGFNGIQQQFDKAADGADQLADGSQKIDNGLHKADASTAQLVTGLGQLASGATALSTGNARLAAGATQLADGAGRLASGAGTLATGLDKLKAGTAQLPSQSTALAKGGRSLAAGSTRVAQGATQLATALTTAVTAVQALPGQTSALARGADTLAAGIDTLAAGARPLATGAKGVAAGGEALARGAQQLADGAGDVATGTKAAADGAQGVAKATGRLSDGVSDYTRSVSDLAGDCPTDTSEAFCARLERLAAQGGSLRSGASALDASASRLASSTGRLATGAAGLADGAGPLTQGADRLATGAAQLDAGATRFAKGTTALTTGSRSLSSNLRTLAAKAPELGAGLTKAQGATGQLAQGATAVATGATRLTSGLDRLAAAAPALASGVAQADAGAHALATGATKLQSGATSLASGARDASSGATKLASGAEQAHSGSTRLASGLSRLASGSSDLDAGIDRLAKGLHEGADKVPTYDASARDRLASVVASPVSEDATRLHKVASYGYGLTPYFLSLALWVGGMAMYMMLRPLSLDALRRRVAPWRVSLGGLLPGLVLGIGQVAVLLAVLRFGVGIEAADPWSLAAMALLASVTFVAVNHALVAVLGPAGRFLGLVLIVLQLSSAGATYPIETSPGFFRVMHVFLPMTYSVRAFRDLVAGGDVDLTSSVCVLLGWLVGALVLGVWGARRALTRPIETDGDVESAETGEPAPAGGSAEPAPAAQGAQSDGPGAGRESAKVDAPDADPELDGVDDPDVSETTTSPAAALGEQDESSGDAATGRE